MLWLWLAPEWCTNTGFKLHVILFRSGLMIMASHQTFSGQIKYMSGQIKFVQTNFLYITTGNFVKFAKDNECPDNFQSLS